MFKPGNSRNSEPKSSKADEQTFDTAYDILRKPSVRKIDEERYSSMKTSYRKILFQRLKDSAQFLKSPLFTVQLILFAIGNSTVSLSLNIVNDMICRVTHDDNDDFNTIQKNFEIVRGVIATVSCFLMGFATDLSMKIWNKTSSRNKDVQKTLFWYGETVYVNRISIIEFR